MVPLWESYNNDYKVVLGFELRDLLLLGRHPTT
jgi:hypothetical protein